MLIRRWNARISTSQGAPEITDSRDIDDGRHIELIARDLSLRAAGAVGLAGIALIHLLDSIGKYGETRYLFWMYVGLMVSSLVVAGAVLIKGTRITWVAAGALAASAIAGYVINRTVGMPNATDDIGNWTEPLGLASLFVEGCVVALSGMALALARKPSGARSLTRQSTTAGVPEAA